MKYPVLIAALWCTCSAFAQSAREKFVDVSLAVGSSQGASSVSYLYNWRLGKKKKFELGVGGRFTFYLGASQYYSTAPAKLTSGATGPGVLFTDNVNANIDTLLVSSPRVFALNAMVNLGFHFNEKFSVGFNIDAIGLSFGGQKTSNYINGSMGSIVGASPTAFNLLLVSDNDLGTLNSELVGRYKMDDKWSLKAGAQFLFTEYTTVTPVQQFPEPNDRFRNKSLMLVVGISLKLQ